MTPRNGDRGLHFADDEHRELNGSHNRRRNMRRQKQARAPIALQRCRFHLAR